MGSIERFLAHAGVAWWCCLSSLVHAQQPARSDAPTRAQCLAQHEHAQDERIAGRLLAARASLRECSAAACPTLVSRDCVNWLAEVEQQIPSVIFAGAKDGEDLVTLRVREGERLLAENITGTPLELDPGPHHFVAELPGFPPQEATYVLQAGDKSRVVRFEFVSEAAPVPHPSATPALPSSRAQPPRALWRPIPTVTYALAGASLVAAVTGSVLGTLALSKRKEFDRACAPLCDDREVSSVRSLALGADIAIAVALLSAGGAVYTYATRPSIATRDAATLYVTWSGFGLTTGGSF
jgi:hypothetical protein